MRPPLLVLLFLCYVTSATCSRQMRFTLRSHNASEPAVDGKQLRISSDGGAFLDAGSANPSPSYELIAFLQDTRLRRFRQRGSPAATEGNLDFGTSMVCCDYARLNFSTPNGISFSAHNTPFFLIGSQNNTLVYGSDPVYDRRPWYACTRHPGDKFRVVYYNKPFYDFPDHGDSECIAVTLTSEPFDPKGSHSCHT